MRIIVYPSAKKHHIPVWQIRYAVAHAVVTIEKFSQSRIYPGTYNMLIIGRTKRGQLLEVIAFCENNTYYVFHCMKLRKKYAAYLGGDYADSSETPETYE